MEQGKQLLMFVVLLALVCALLPVNETRSIPSSKHHKIKKRSLYEETCPPPFIIEITEQCNDSCFDDDYCVGNQMCCFDGCSYVCMDPVPSEPVIDWIEDRNNNFTELFGGGELEVVTPVIEELGCYYHGMTINDGEKLLLDCRICSCFNGNLMCDVANCNKEYQARLALERSGSGSGANNDDDDDDDDDDEVKGEGSGDDNWYPIGGVEHKEEFIPFEEFEKKEFEKKENSGVEAKGIFIPFDKDNSNKLEQSGEEDNTADRGENFIPFDEETNNEQSGDEVASFARRRL